MTKVNNFYTALPADLPEELVETLVSSKQIRIERIISEGHKSPEEFWYDQEWHEWILLIQGTATLEFKEPQDTVHLKAGDYLFIDTHQKHRVTATSNTEQTIWLAVHFQ